MKRFNCFLLAMLVAAPALDAQVVVQIRRSKTSNVDYYASNYGIFGLNVATSRSGHVVPRGSGLSYIFGAGIWFGGKKRVDGTLTPLSFVTYNPDQGTSWARPDDSVRAGTGSPAAPYYSGDYDHTTGRGLSTIISIPGWPLWTSVQRPATMLESGAFVVDTAARSAVTTVLAPAFIPGVSEQYVSRYNDFDLEAYDSPAPGLPFGLIVNEHVCSWSTGEFKNAVVLKYEVINVSSDTLVDCSLASVFDADLGNAANDHAGFYQASPDLRTAYFYTDPESGKAYGTLLATLLEGPVADGGFIQRGVRSQYKTMGAIGTFQNWGVEESPFTPAARYNFMTLGEHDGDNGPGDKRGLLSTETFSMLPGDTAFFSVAYTVVPDLAAVSSQASVPQIDELVSDLIDLYYGTSSSVPVDHTITPSLLTTVPNPARDGATISFSLSAPSHPVLRIVDNLGRTVTTRELGALGAGSHDRTIDVSALASGVYHVTIESEGRSASTPLVIVR